MNDNQLSRAFKSHKCGIFNIIIVQLS